MLQVYHIANSTFQPVSVGTFEQPALLQITPGGQGFVKKLFLRNGDPSKYYTDITIKPVSTIGADIIDGSISIKILSGDSKPKEAQWEAALANSAALLESPVEGVDKTTRIPNIGSANGADLNYYPFWIRVEGAKAVPIGTSRFSLSVTYTESSI